MLLELIAIWRVRQARTLPPLLDGRELMRALRLEPGPRVGRMLARIREAQEESQLHTKDEALEWARRELG